MSKHTPAPWHFGFKTIYACGEHGRTYPIATVFDHDLPDKSEAVGNAQLISAAPDLLEALIRLLPMAEDDALQYGGKPDCDDDITFARAAIAKANGEGV